VSSNVTELYMLQSQIYMNYTLRQEIVKGFRYACWGKEFGITCMV